ncbi:MAG: hypothetical protein ABH822_00710 [Patescibacteria group bacterium]
MKKNNKYFWIIFCGIIILLAVGAYFVVYGNFLAGAQAPVNDLPDYVTYGGYEYWPDDGSGDSGTCSGDSDCSSTEECVAELSKVEMRLVTSGTPVAATGSCIPRAFGCLARVTGGYVYGIICIDPSYPSY